MEKKVSECMSKRLITIHKAATMSSAYERMKKNGIRHLPVIDETKEIIGILSDRDVNRAVHSTINNTEGWRSEELNFGVDSIVADYMTWPIKSFDKSTPLQAVIKKMISEKISSFLISDAGRMVGIITSDDLLHVLDRIIGEQGEDSKLSLNDLLLNPLFTDTARLAAGAGI